MPTRRSRSASPERPGPERVAPLLLATALLIAGCGRAGVAPPEVLRVVAIGEDFSWRFVYPGADGRLGSADDLASEHLLRVPVDSRVEVQLASRDYVYLFDADPLGAREIAAPGLDFTVTFRTDATGSHPLPVDPLCGLSALHDGDMGRIEIVSRAAFSHWQARLAH